MKKNNVVRRSGGIIAFICLLFVILPAQAQLGCNLAANGSFEIPNIQTEPQRPGENTAFVNGWAVWRTTTYPIDGWETVSGTVDFLRHYNNASDGAQSIDLLGTASATFQQTFTNLTPGQSYAFSIDYSGHSTTDSQADVLLDQGGGFQLVQTLSPVADSVNNGTGGIPNTPAYTVTWATFSHTFEATGTEATIRFVNTGSLPSTGLFIDNFVFEGQEPCEDFGDAPASYGTLLADNGPRHEVIGYDPAAHTALLMLGNGVSIESGGQPDPDAALDEFDDGVVANSISLVAGATTASVGVLAVNDTAGDATLAGWIDFDDSGAFDTGERAEVTVPANTTTPTEFTLDWSGLDPIPADFQGFARFRIATDASEVAGPVGAAGDGEVEDYVVPIVQPPLQTCSIEEVRATERWWFFGTNGAIDFDVSGTTATPFLGSQSAVEGTTVVTDTAGQLLFWSNGQTVFDRDSNPMPNGGGLLGNFSATQTVAAFPSLDQPGLYFVVTTSTDVGGAPNGNLNYSVVDMALNGGLGDIVAGQKNLPLGPANTASEALTAIPNANGTGFWVLTYTNNSPDFLAYAFDGNGPVTGNPVVSVMPSNHHNGFGTINISADLDQIVALSGIWPGDTTGTVRLLQFDAASGQAVQSLQWALPVGAGMGNSGYSADFSPAGDYVYVTKIFGGGQLYRYDIANNSTGPDVEASMEQLGDISNGSTQGGQVRRAPDGRMYVAGHTTGFLSVVNDPDNPADPGFVPAGFPLPAGSLSSFGLPQTVTGCPSPGPAQITVIKQPTVPDGTIFPFATTAEAPDDTFELSSDTGLSYTFSVPPGLVSVTEAAVPDWEISDISCVDEVGNASFTYTGATTDPSDEFEDGDDAANITIGGGGQVTCTFANATPGEAWTVSKTVSPDGPAQPGEVVTYTITVENTGGTDLTGLIVEDDLTGVLGSADYNNDETATGGNVSYSEPVVTWTGDLAAGQTVTISYSVTVDDPLTSGAEVQVFSGTAQAWTTDSTWQNNIPGNSPVMAINAPDGNGVQLWSDQNNSLALDMANVVPAGETVVLHLAVHVNTVFQGDVLIESSADGVSYGNPITVTPTDILPDFGEYDYAVPAGGARFIRITPQDNGQNGTAVRVDALTYAYEFLERAGAVNLVQQGSFEAFPECSLQNGTLGDWTAVNIHIWGNNCGQGWVAPDGVNTVDLDGNSTTSGELEQVITGLTPGEVYNLTFYMAFNPAAGAASASMRLTIADFDDIYTSASNATIGGFNRVHVTFTAQNTSETLRFESLTGSGDPNLIGGGGTVGFGVVFDVVRITLQSDLADIGDANLVNAVTGSLNCPSPPVTDPDDQNFNPDCVTITPLAGIELFKTATPAQALPGTTVTYTFTAINTGSLPLTDVVISETGFSGTGAISALDCTPAQPAVLDPEDILECTATYVVEEADVAAGVLTNTAQVVGTDPDDNAVTDEAEAQVQVLAPPQPALPTLAKYFNTDPASDPPPVQPPVIPRGGTALLTFVINNTQPVTEEQTDLEFTDTLPPGLVLAGGDSPPDALVGANTCGGTVTAQAGTAVISLSGGTVAENAECSFTVRVTTAP